MRQRRGEHPAVAGHLAASTRPGMPILVLYGAFGQGVWGAGKLASLGKAAAGKAFACHAWTQALASAAAGR